MLVTDNWASVSVTVGVVIVETVRESPSGSLSGVPPVITFPASRGVPNAAVSIEASLTENVFAVAVGLAFGTSIVIVVWAMLLSASPSLTTTVTSRAVAFILCGARLLLYMI